MYSWVDYGTSTSPLLLFLGSRCNALFSSSSNVATWLWIWTFVSKVVPFLLLKCFLQAVCFNELRRQRHMHSSSSSCTHSWKFLSENPASPILHRPVGSETRSSAFFCCFDFGNIVSSHIYNIYIIYHIYIIYMIYHIYSILPICLYMYHMCA